MSSEPVTPPPADEQVENNTTVEPSVQALVEIQRPDVKFSVVHWAATGVIRVVYRLWTRVAANVFPENSAGERIAQALHIPLPDALNMSWINDHLAVGGRIRPEDIKLLGLIGVTQVVDTRSEYCDDAQALAHENIELLHVPARDTYPLTVEQLMEGAAWVDNRIKHGGRVLIHCEHGVGRSVLLTCAVLVYQGMHAGTALELVKQKRWQASPNHRQVARLREFESACVEAQRKA
ncbi:MAG TPA: dual specificity protein phosphatase [Ktedonobacteraceae bacterium]|nr:dual specificity protein phosphatase [Ktedonobacteraceae bacterium]